MATYTGSRTSVRAQIEFFRSDPYAKSGDVQIRARALELAEVFYVGGELSKENIGKFITLFKDGRLVAANDLCAKANKAGGTQHDCAVEVAKFGTSDFCAPRPRPDRCYLRPQPATGFWQTSPLFVAAAVTPLEDGGVPVGCGLR